MANLKTFTFLLITVPQFHEAKVERSDSDQKIAGLVSGMLSMSQSVLKEDTEPHIVLGGYRISPLFTSNF